LSAGIRPTDGFLFHHQPRMASLTESENDSLVLHPDVVFRAVGDEGVVVDQRRPEVMVVNHLALRVLQLIQETGSRDAVLAALESEYQVEPTVIAADMDHFLADLRGRGLV
jgi:hypothetical protein